MVGFTGSLSPCSIGCVCGYAQSWAWGDYINRYDIRGVRGKRGKGDLIQFLGNASGECCLCRQSVIEQLENLKGDSLKHKAF